MHNSTFFVRLIFVKKLWDDLYDSAGTRLQWGGGAGDFLCKKVTNFLG
jgi:hypothetical protein